MYVDILSIYYFAKSKNLRDYIFLFSRALPPMADLGDESPAIEHACNRLRESGNDFLFIISSEDQHECVVSVRIGSHHFV